jgi:hypothetical protein
LLYEIENEKPEMAADIQLGLRIYQHIKEFGVCEFEAEL